MPLRSGAGPQFSSSGAPLLQFDSCAFWSLTMPPRFSFSRILSEPPTFCCKRAGVVGNGPLQSRRQIEYQRHREQDRHDPCGDSDLTLSTPKSAHPLGDPLTGQCEEQQRQGGTERERAGEHDGSHADGCGGPGHDDRGENGSRAGDVKHAQRQTESETVAAGW